VGGFGTLGTGGVIISKAKSQSRRLRRVDLLVLFPGYPPPVPGLGLTPGGVLPRRLVMARPGLSCL